MAASSAIFVALLSGWCVAITIAFLHNYWLSGALAVLASLPPVAAFAVLRQVFDRRVALRLAAARAALGQFQAAALAEHIAGDPAFLLVPREQSAAILFIDLAGYTGLSESFGPRRTRDVLKAFHTIVVNETRRRHGLVLDFMGDGVMIGFGVPDQKPNDAANALSAAFGLVQAVGDWIAAAELGADLSAVRVGAHYGSIVLSRLGHEDHQQIAVTGDSVNVASRLLEIARHRQAAAVLSSELVTAAGSPEVLLLNERRFSTVSIRGRRQPVDVAILAACDIATRQGYTASRRDSVTAQ